MKHRNKRNWIDVIRKTHQCANDFEIKYTSNLTSLVSMGKINLDTPPTECEQLALSTGIFIVNTLRHNDNITNDLITKSIKRTLYELYGVFDFDAFVDRVNNIFGKRSENNGKE